MSLNYSGSPLIFLVDTLLSLYILVVAFRIIMQWAQWEYHHPIVQFIIKATQVPVKALRRFIPAVGRWDTATFVLLFLLTLVKFVIISAIQPIAVPGFILMWVVVDIIALFISIFTISIIIEVALSWITPAGSHNPIAPLLHSMNNPILKPIRQKMPPMGGIDLSPLVAVIGLQFLSMLVMQMLMA